MTLRQFNKSEIIAILKEVHAGKRAAHICEQYSICIVTFFHWTRVYGHLLEEGASLKT